MKLIIIAYVLSFSQVLYAEKPMKNHPLIQDLDHEINKAAITDKLSSQLEVKLSGADSDQNNEFGHSVSINGNRAVIGVPNDSDLNLNAGSVYFFEFDGDNWNQTNKLTASDGKEGDKFGKSVSLSNDRVIIGAFGDDNEVSGKSSGSAYAFDYDGSNWIQTANFSEVNGSDHDLFGISVSLDNNRAVVGVPQDNDNGFSSGSAYVYEFNGNNWSLVTKLLANDGGLGDYFGESVSIHGDKLIVGAHGDDDNGSFAGAAYIFEFNGSNWIQTDKLMASDGEKDDYFAYSVSIHGNRALIGTVFDDDNGVMAGAAYIFDFNGTQWIETQKLKANDGVERDQFGFSVSLFENRALVGERDDFQNGLYSGAAYVFDFDGNTWSQSTKLLASDGDTWDRLGSAVSIWGNQAFLGAPLKEVGGVATGAAYIYNVDANIEHVFSNGFE